MCIFNADHHFVIGQEHVTQGKPCQDHALSFSDGGSAGIVVADGCSSGGETDMGARVLTFGTIAAMHACRVEKYTDLALVAQVIAQKGCEALASSRTMFGLAREDTLATCAYAYATKDGCTVTLFGDGVLACKYRDGTIVMSRFDWANNTPFYPAYSGDDDKSFAIAHGGDDVLAFSEERWSFAEAKGFMLDSERKLPLSEGARGVTRHFSRSECETLESVAVFTDGVTRIDGVDWKEAVCVLLAFRNTAGVFAKRRMNSVLREMRKEGKWPLDDIAYAVIGVTLTNEEGEDRGDEGTAQSRS